MVSRCDHSRGRDFRGRGHGFVRGVCGSYGGRQSASEKGPLQCRHCGRSNYISERCWEKFGRPEWVQPSESDFSAPHSTSQDYLSTSSTIPESFTVVLNRRSMINFDS